MTNDVDGAPRLEPLVRIIDINFEKAKKPPTEWQRHTLNIKETWRVYAAEENIDYCFLSPLFGAEIHSTQAINEAMRNYVGDWPVMSAELITWDNLLKGQECFVLS